MKKTILIFLMVLGLLSASQAVIISSTTFNSAMGVGESANFDIVTTPDTLVSFGYNWSNLSTEDPTNSGYTTVPNSPNGGDSIGCRMECNNGDANAFKAGIAIYAKVTTNTNSYDLTADIYASYTLPIAGGGSGSTWHLGITAFASGTVINTITDTDLSVVDPAFLTSGVYTTQDGISFGYAPDAGDATSDFWCFNPTARTGGPATAQSNGQAGTWTGATSAPPGAGTGANITDPVYYAGFSANYPVGRVTTGGNETPGYTWNTLKASVSGNVVSFYINNVKYCTVVSSQTTAKRVGIVVTDPYTSIANPTSQAYVLVDNVRVIEYTNTTDVEKTNWMLFN